MKNSTQKALKTLHKKLTQARQDTVLVEQLYNKSFFLMKRYEADLNKSIKREHDIQKAIDLLNDIQRV